jgi:hypothetical protein
MAQRTTPASRLASARPPTPKRAATGEHDHEGGGGTRDLPPSRRRSDHRAGDDRGVNRAAAAREAMASAIDSSGHDADRSRRADRKVAAL